MLSIVVYCSLFTWFTVVIISILEPRNEEGSLYDAQSYYLKDEETVYRIIILRDGSHAVVHQFEDAL